MKNGKELTASFLYTHNSDAPNLIQSLLIPSTKNKAHYFGHFYLGSDLFCCPILMKMIILKNRQNLRGFCRFLLFYLAAQISISILISGSPNAVI